MDKLKWGAEFPVETARNVVEHSGVVGDATVPVFTRHLFHCKVGAGYLNESAPGAFNKTIRALSLGEGRNDLGIVVIDSSEALVPHDVLVKVGVK